MSCRCRTARAPRTPASFFQLRHAIAIRHDLIPGEGNVYMRSARWATVPVINMQCDVDHPCQTLADLMTIREQRGQDLRASRSP